MNKGLTELVFILDRSGSMRGLEPDTIGGFNGMIRKQKLETESGEALVSVVLFDDKQEVLYDRVPLSKVPDMTEKDYYVRGCTALLDAIGDAVRHIRNVHKYARDEDRPEKTLFIITTDGMENASRRYSYEMVKQLIEAQKKDADWEFLFLGANIDAVQEAARFGINANRAVEYTCDSEGTRKNFSALGKAVKGFRAAPKAARGSAISDDWKEEIEEDHKSRGKERRGK